MSTSKQEPATYPVQIVREGKPDRMAYILNEKAPFMSHFGHCCVCDSPIPPDLNPDDGFVCSTACAKVCIAEVN
jgi:hypothetical protein